MTEEKRVLGREELAQKIRVARDAIKVVVDAFIGIEADGETLAELEGVLQMFHLMTIAEGGR